MATEAASSSTAGSARPPQTKDELETYMKQREVIKADAFALVVDGFRFTSQYLKLRYGELPPGQLESGGHRTTFILTHFHSDHYVGLHKSWAFGKILCSRGTGMLLQTQLGVPADRITLLEMDQIYLLDLRTSIATIIEGLSIAAQLDALEPHQVLLTMVGANHCPAAVILVMESKVFGNIVHTGDFRYNGKSTASVGPAHQRLSTSHPFPKVPIGFREKYIGDHPALRRVAGNVDVLFLDNTFCDRTFRFPTQSAVFQQVANIVEDGYAKAFDAKHGSRSVTVTAGESFVDFKGDSKQCSCYSPHHTSPSNQHFRRKRCVHIAVLVGTYTIGKERVALALKNKFGVPIYASPDKSAILECCDAAREFGCGDDAFRCATKTEDISEASVSLSALSSLAERGEAQRALSFSDDDDDAPRDEENVAAFLTVVLVPLSVLSYPYLAEALNPQKKGEAGASENSPRAGSVLPLPTVDDASAAPAGGDVKQAGGAIRLWGECELDLKKYDAVIGIEPTGWAEGRSPSRVLKKVGKKITVHSVPYSEHCSFDEMVDFVAFVKPLCVVPTVSFEMFSKNEPLFVERCPRLRSKYSNTQPLSKFQHLFKKLAPAQTSAVGSTQIQATPTPATSLGVFAPVPENIVNADAGDVIKAAKQNNPFGKRPRIEEHKVSTLPKRDADVTLISDDEGNDEVEIIPASYVIEDD